MLTALVAFASLLWAAFMWVRMDAAFRARDSAVKQLADESERRTELEKRLRALGKPDQPQERTTPMRILAFSARELRFHILRFAIKELRPSAWLYPSVWLALAKVLWVCVPVYIETVPTRTP